MIAFSPNVGKGTSAEELVQKIPLAKGATAAGYGWPSIAERYRVLLEEVRDEIAHAPLPPARGLTRLLQPTPTPSRLTQCN